MSSYFDCWNHKSIYEKLIWHYFRSTDLVPLIHYRCWSYKSERNNYVSPLPACVWILIHRKFAKYGFTIQYFCRKWIGGGWYICAIEKGIWIKVFSLQLDHSLIKRNFERYPRPRGFPILPYVRSIFSSSLKRQPWAHQNQSKLI